MDFILFLCKGYLFLLAVIIFNYLLGIFKIKNWYYFLYNFKNPRLNIVDYLFLFLIYPLFLGILVYLINLF